MIPKFLTNEKDFSLQDIRMLCLFSSKLAKPFADMFLSTVKASWVNGEAICVDIAIFNSFIKRFNLVECPTIILLKDGIEEKRFSGLRNLKPITEK